jgi:AbrB family looped-hinge helix DNA binding protein
MLGIFAWFIVDERGQLSGRDLLKLRFMRSYSSVGRDGRTTIPREIRQALKIKSGNKLEFSVEGDRATMRVHPGTQSLAGALASDKGKRLSIRQIRAGV